MRIPTLFLAGLMACGLSANAQTKTDLKTSRPKHPFRRAELDLEGAMTLAFTPNYVAKAAVVKPSDRNTGIGWSFLVKYITPGYSKVRLGFRLGISNLRVSDDIGAYATGGSNIIKKYPAKYANPLVQIGLQAHYDAYITPKMDVRISPFAGWGYAWSNKIEGGGSNITAVPVGNTQGFNAGIDASLKIKTSSNLSALISTGYQYSWMRRVKEDAYSSGYALIPGDSDNGFNLSHFSLGAGVAITF